MGKLDPCVLNDVTVISYIVNGSKSFTTRKVLLCCTLKVFTEDIFIVSLMDFTELSEGSMICASKDLSVVTLTMYCTTESVFSTGGLHDTLTCFSFRGSTSTSSGGLGRSSEIQA